MVVSASNQSDALDATASPGEIEEWQTRRITELEQRMTRIERGGTLHGWRWGSISENEKWFVWWGVFWRGLVVSMGLWVLFIVLGLLVGAMT